MTAMLSLQVFYIFRVLDKSSRGNHGVTHKFVRNFLRRSLRQHALEIDLQIVRAVLSARKLLAHARDVHRIGSVGE